MPLTAARPFAAVRTAFASLRWRRTPTARPATGRVVCDACGWAMTPTMRADDLPAVAARTGACGCGGKPKVSRV